MERHMTDDLAEAVKRAAIAGDVASLRQLVETHGGAWFAPTMIRRS
jgi:hypothetical protein